MPVIGIILAFCRTNITGILIAGAVTVGVWIVKDVVSTYMENVALKSDIATIHEGIKEMKVEQAKLLQIQQQNVDAIREVLTHTGDASTKLAADIAAIRGTKDESACPLPSAMATALGQLQRKPRRSENTTGTPAGHATTATGTNPVPGRPPTPKR